MDNTNQNSGVIFPNDGQASSSSTFASNVGSPQALSLDNAPVDAPVVTEMPAVPKKRDRGVVGRIVRRADIIAVVLLILGSVGLVLSAQNTKQPEGGANSQYAPTEIPLNELNVNDEGVSFDSQIVTINGALVVAPSLQPSTPTAGQIYFDQTSSELAYFNGTNFVPLGQSVGVQNIGGMTGIVNVGAGLSAVGGQLTNSGVLSVQGQTGNVTFSAGNGVGINGTTIFNTGIVSVTSSTPALTVTTDANGNVTLSGSGSGTVASPGGTAGRVPVFSGNQEISDSLISQAGTTVTVNGDLSVTGGVSLSSALTVSNGGTGATSLTLNGVLVGQGGGAISSVTAAGAGLCLMSTVGAPAFSACPGGGGGVTSLEGLTGALTISNATGVGTNITIDDATNAAKGIASYNATNFNVVGGAVNTIQDINSGATPTFAGVNTNNITPSAALTVGISAQTALLQGSTTTITSSGVGNDIVLNSADTIELQDNTNVTGNVVASGDVAVNGGDLTSSGALNITPGGTLTAGVSGQTLTLQGNASTSLRSTDSGNTTIVGFVSPTANTTLNFPALSAGTYTICTSSGNCPSAGATLQSAYNNSTTPEIVLDATRAALTLRDNATPIGGNLLEVQNNAGDTTYLAVTSSGIAVTGTATVSGNINSSGGALQTSGTNRIDASGNASNIGSLTLSGAISGGTTYSGSGNINTTGGVIQTNSTTRIDNSGNLTNIAAITASGNAAIQGGTATLGAAAQQGSLVLHDGNGQTATISVGSALVASTALAIPTGVGAADTFCLLTLANCAGAGGGVTTPGGTPNTVSKFTGAQTIGDSIITDDGSTVTIGGTLAVNTITPTSAFTAGATGQTTTLQGSTTTITSSGGNNIVLNSGGTIELQDNTNVTGNLDVSGTIAAGTGNAFQVSSGGAVTAVGVNAGAGLLQGALGLTVSGGAVSLNNNSNFATSLNTGTSNGTITLGGGSAPLVIDSTAFDVTSGGALSGITTIATSGAINSQTISSAANFTGTMTIQGSNALTLGVTGTSTGAILFKGATAASGTITLIGQANPTGSQTITLPDASGEVCLTTGNCAGSGSGVTTSGGATNRLAKFSASQNIENSTVTDDGTNVTTTADLIVQGGDATVGTTAQQGSLILHDGNGQTATIRVGSALGANTIISIPTAVGVSDTVCLLTLANCTGSGSSSTLQAAYDAGNTITTTAARDLAFTLDNDSNLTVATAPATTGFTTFSLTDGSNATPPAQLLLVRNNDTNQALAAGLKVTSAAGTITTALDVSGTNITNALSIGANAITGTNFSVTGAGAVTAVGVNAGAGLLQGALGLTVTGGVASLNNSSNFATNINTGTSNGTITIGGGSAPLVIDSTAFDVTSGGAVSGVTTLNTSGIITVGAIGTADTTTALCRNAANQIAGCTTTGAGAAFVQGGNTFGATATLGTNDANQLDIRTNSTTRLTVGAAGGVTVAANNNLSLASGTGTFGQIYTGTSTDANTITANSLTTGSAFKVTSSNNSAANTAWSANQLNVTNAQSTTAVSTGSIYGFDLQFTQNPTVAGNTESAANFALKQNDSSTTDSTVTSIINVANNDTATGNQITATNGLLINGGNITNGINLSGTFGTNLITSTNFGVTQAGAVTAVGVNAGAGLLQGAAGLTVTGAAINLNASSNFATNINTGTSNGTVTIGGGSAPLVIDSTAFDVSSAGAVSGVSTLALTGTNTISFTTPVGTVLNTKVGIPVYAAGSSDSVISLGLTSGAGSTARGISVFDARTVDHQPSIAVFSPDEASAVGFTWNGSNTIANIQTINGGGAVSKSISLQSGSSNATSGDVTINSGAAATSGAVGIDVGSASVTPGALNIGITNANSITIGRSTTSNALTTVRGRMLVRPATGQDSATAFQVQDAGGTEFFTVNSVTANVVLGKASVATGRLQFQGSGSANALIFTGPTSPSTNTITLPNETGTVCTTGSVCSGYAASTGSGSYIQNQIALQQPTSNFWISNTGRADVSLLTPTLDTATGVTLNIGSTNATAITLGNVTTNPNIAFSGSGTFGTTTGAVSLNGSTTIAATKTLSVTSGLTSLTGNTTGDALNVSNSTSTGNIAVFKDNATNVAVIADNGIVTFQPTTASATAFRVLDTDGTTPLLGVDSSANYLFTDGNFAAVGNIEGDADLIIDDQIFVGGNGNASFFYSDVTLENSGSSATAFRVQNASGADTMFTVDTAARGAGGGNRVKIGNSTGTDGATTILQLDGATADPTSNLAALNGGLFYNSTTNKVSLIENGVVKIICNTTDLGCGTGTVTLQSAYGNGNTITATDNRDIGFNLTDQTTDPNFLIDLQCDTSCSSNGRFAIQNDGVDVLSVAPVTDTVTITSTSTAGVGLTILNSNVGQTTTTLLNVAQSGVSSGFTGNVVNFQGTSTTGSGNLLNLSAANTTAGNALNVTANALTTGNAVNINSTSTGLTTGSLLRVSTGTTAAIDTNGIVSINAAGNYTSTSNNGLMNVLANSTTAGTIMNIQGGALTTGVALNIGANTGTALRVSSGLTTLTNATSGSGTTFNVSNSTSTGNIAVFQDNATTVASIADGGAALFQNQTNSANAFRVLSSTSGELVGVDSTDSILRMLANNTGHLSGTGANWSTGTPLVNARASGSSVILNGYIYQLGGCSSGGAAQAAVSFSQLRSDGSNGDWTSTTVLPFPSCGNSATTYNGYIYVHGGANNATLSRDVYYAKPNADGTITSWATQNDPTNLADHQVSGMAAYNGYLYITAGQSDDGLTTRNRNLYYARINADGSVPSFTVQSNWLTDTDHNPGQVIVANGYLYVMGSSNYDKFYYGRINNNGSVATIAQATGTTSMARKYASIAVMNGYMYAIAGNTGASTSVDYAPLSNTGDIGTFVTDTTTLFEARTVCPSVAPTYNNFVYLVGCGNASFTAQTTMYYASGSKIRVGGGLDLTSYSGEGADAGSSAGQLSAGNTFINGALSVTGNAVFEDGASVNNAFSVTGAANIQTTTNTTTGFQILNASAVPQFVSDTTNSRIYIGNPTSDTTGAILVLDTKSDTGDPTATGLGGAMYYNSLYGRMRCFYDSAWHYCNEYASLSLGYNITEDFVGLDDSVLIGENSWGRDVSGTGATVGGQNAENRRPGIVELETGTTTTVARAAIYLNAMNHEPVIIGGSEEIEFAVNLPTLADGTNDYNVRIGLCDNTDGTDCNSGLYFEYDRDTSANWIYAAANNDGGGSRTKTTSSTAVSTGWHRFRISVNTAANSVTYYLDGVSLGTAISTNIPTASTQPTFVIAKDNPTGAATRLMRVDYFQMRNSVTTPR